MERGLCRRGAGAESQLNLVPCVWAGKFFTLTFNLEVDGKIGFGFELSNKQHTELSNKQHTVTRGGAPGREGGRGFDLIILMVWCLRHRPESKSTSSCGPAVNPCFRTMIIRLINGASLVRDSPTSHQIEIGF